MLTLLPGTRHCLLITPYPLTTHHPESNFSDASFFLFDDVFVLISFLYTFKLKSKTLDDDEEDV